MSRQELHYIGPPQDSAAAHAALFAVQPKDMFTEQPESRLVFNGPSESFEQLLRLAPSWRQYTPPEELQLVAEHLGRLVFRFCLAGQGAIMLWIHLKLAPSPSPGGWLGMGLTLLVAGAAFLGTIVFAMPWQPRWQRILFGKRASVPTKSVRAPTGPVR